MQYNASTESGLRLLYVFAFLKRGREAKKLSFWDFCCEKAMFLNYSCSQLWMFGILFHVSGLRVSALAITPQCKGETLFWVILGLSIYSMGNRPTTMRYLIKFGGGPHRKGLRISLIA